MVTKILVTGAGGPAGINTIRALKDAYFIVSTDINEYSEGFLFSHKYYLIHPAKDEENFLQDIDKILEEEKIDIGIVTIDEELEVFAKYYNKYKDYFILHPPDTIDICLDKYKTYEYFSNKLPEIVPEFSLNPEDLKSEAILKKPRKGRGSKNIEVKRKNEIKKEEGFVYVEYLPGREWTVDIITDKDGIPMAIIPRVRLKTRGGISVVGKVELNERIINLSKKILEKLLFTGPLNIQFKENDKGEPKLQEINPRFSGGLDIVTAAGINLPKILVEYWLFNKKPLSYKVLEKIYYRIWEIYY